MVEKIVYINVYSHVVQDAFQSRSSEGQLVLVYPYADIFSQEMEQGGRCLHFRVGNFFFPLCVQQDNEPADTIVCVNHGNGKQ